MSTVLNNLVNIDSATHRVWPQVEITEHEQSIEENEEDEDSEDEGDANDVSLEVCWSV